MIIYVSDERKTLFAFFNAAPKVQMKLSENSSSRLFFKYKFLFWSDKGLN